MSYASNTDLRDRMGAAAYVQLTDDEGSGSADEAKATEARLAAEGEVDSYLGRRYAVPVALAGREELAAILKSITLDLAECRLRARRPPVPADVRRKREDAVAWLAAAASGEVIPPSAAGLERNPALGPVAESAGPTRTMTREALRIL